MCMWARSAILAFFALAVTAGQTQRKSAAPNPTISTNLNNCVKGLSDCDISVLNPNELKQVSEAARTRNWTIV